MSARSKLLILTVAVPLGAVLSAWWNSPLQILFGLLLVLVMPGLSMGFLLGPAFRRDWVEETAIVLGLSLCVSVLGAFLLNATTWGLTRWSWIVYLGSITILCSALSLLRSPAEESSQGPSIDWRSRTVGQIVMLGVALLLGAGAYVEARAGAEQESGHGFTQLWLLPGGHAHPSNLQLGVKSEESHPMVYSLKVLSGHDVLRSWTTIRLSPNGTWHRTITVEAGNRPARITAQLYRAGHLSQPYRRVWLNVESGTQSTRSHS